METFRLGRTNLIISRTGFGALPVQRADMDEAGRILRDAYDAGITFFDTARAYSDSEEKIGAALADVRSEIVIATKSLATTADGVRRDLETSLQKLRTNYVDIFQLHNPATIPDADDPTSSYAALCESRKQGLVRHIGITNHRRDVARKAISSGLFETLQFPLSAISDREDLALIDLCRQHDVGVIAMKALCGGLLTNAAAAFAFLRRFPNVVPIWGCQSRAELAAFIMLEKDPPVYDAALRAQIHADREALAENFCRACGYCLPCPADIPIPTAARMSLLLRRMPPEPFLTPEWRKKMERVRSCQQCGKCHERCPYGLDAAALLPVMLADYEQMYEKFQAG